MSSPLEVRTIGPNTYRLVIDAIRIPGATAGQTLVCSVGPGGVLEFRPGAGGGGGGGIPAPGSPTRGAMVYFDGGAWVELHHGREGYQLKVSGGVPRWSSGAEPPTGYVWRFEAAAVNGVDLYNVPNVLPSNGALSTFTPSLTTGGTPLTAAGAARPNFDGTTPPIPRVQVFTTTNMRGTPAGGEFPVGGGARTIALIGSGWAGPPTSFFVGFGPNATSDPDGGGFAFGVLGSGQFGWRAGGTVNGTFGITADSNPHLFVFRYDGVGAVKVNLDGGSAAPQTGILTTLPDELRLGDGTSSFDLFDFLVWDRELSDGEVSELARYAGRLTGQGWGEGGGGGGGGMPTIWPGAVLVRTATPAAATLYAAGSTTVATYGPGPAFHAMLPRVWTIPAKQGNCESSITLFFEEVGGAGSTSLNRTNTTGSDLTERWDDLALAGDFDGVEGYVVTSVVFSVTNTTGVPEVQTVGGFRLAGYQQ